MTIDAEHNELVILSVSNGWVVESGRMNYRRDGYTSAASHVARTPKELADLVADWASRQQDAKSAGGKP